MLNLTKDEINARIAKNIAAIFNETDKITIINLGVGIPTQVSNYVTNDKVFLQAETVCWELARLLMVMKLILSL